MLLSDVIFEDAILLVLFKGCGYGYGTVSVVGNATGTVP